MSVRMTVMTAVLAVAGLPGPAAAKSSGLVNNTGPFATCRDCHASKAMLGGTISGVSAAHAGSTYTLTLSCAPPAGSSATYPRAGLDVAVSCGTLSTNAGEPDTKLIYGEIVHAQPKTLSTKDLLFKFDWTAPGKVTSCGVSAAGLLANGDTKESGDLTCSATKSVTVNAPDGGLPDTGADSDAAVKLDQGTGADGPVVDGAAGRDASSAADAAALDGGASLDTGGPAREGDTGCDCRLAAGPGDPARAQLFCGLLGLSLSIFLVLRRR